MLHGGAVDGRACLAQRRLDAREIHHAAQFFEEARRAVAAVLPAGHRVDKECICGSHLVRMPLFDSRSPQALGGFRRGLRRLPVFIDSKHPSSA